MISMTTISPTFREQDVVRDAGGRFDSKNNSTPEVTFDADFDMATFMQEPPAAEPFALFQPVIYTDMDGTETHATVITVHDDGRLTLVEREPGTFGDTEDDAPFTVDGRYTRPDEDVSVHAARLQAESVPKILETVQEFADFPDDVADGVDAYLDALKVMDELEVDEFDGNYDAFRQCALAASTAVTELVDRDLLTDDVAYLAKLAPGHLDPPSFSKVNDRYASAWMIVEAAASAKLLETYGDRAGTESYIPEHIGAVAEHAKDFGHRWAKSQTAAETIDAEYGQVRDSGRIDTLDAHMAGLPVAEHRVYTESAERIQEAFDALCEHSVLSADQGEWRNYPSESAVARTAAQAAIVRHFQWETGITTAELDNATGVYTDALKKWAAA